MTPKSSADKQNRKPIGKPIGRPPGGPDVGEWRVPFLASLQHLGNVRAAAKSAGVTRKTAYEHRKKDQDFAAAWDEAMDDACDRLELIARKRATKTSDLLLIFLLKAHRPEKFRDNHRVEMTGKDGGPLRTQNMPPAPNLKALTDEEFAALEVLNDKLYGCEPSEPTIANAHPPGSQIGGKPAELR